MSLRFSELRSALQHQQLVVRESVPLAPLTHVRIGGPARFFVEPMTEAAVSVTVRRCRELEVPLYVLGGGSNLVVADAGVEGVVMSLARLQGMVRDGLRITAGAGVTLASLLRSSRELGLAGLEKLCGIPAHVGGAVAMNAGTRDGETFDALVSVTVVDEHGELRSLDRAECTPRYRDGGLGEQVVLGATFELTEDQPKAIFQRFEDSLRRRNATQPVSMKSVGCVFRNPDGASAGQRIEAAGCKLLRRGGVSVSAKHANYFVNDDGGTCADFLGLMEMVRERVLADSGAELVPEVKVWGL